MREIKFRAFDTENKTWTFATLGDLICGACTKKGDKPLSGAKQVWEQYTGLKDKNGKEIYEGDIVKRFKPHKFLKGVTETEVFRIRWGVRKAGFFAYNKARKKHSQPAKRLNDNDIYEVIGNIHEKPELLEQKG